MPAETYRFTDDGSIPNSALPLLVYRRALTGLELAGAFERLFAAHGWGGAWRNGIFGYHHFHSTSHEVLGIAAGEALVRFGGERGASLTIAVGNAVVIPAGVGHCLERGSPDLLVVGAYPQGRSWDIRRGARAERAAVLANLAAVPLPATDPVHGSAGPLLQYWSAGPRVP